MGAALQQVKSKLSTSLAAPERPLFDLGVGLNAEFDTAELSLVVRGILVQHRVVSLNTRSQSPSFC